MVCYYCKNNTIVTNSRHQKKLNTVWRRRKCLSCNSTMTTIETCDLASTLIVANKSHLTPFERDKLYLSVYKCLGHRKNPINNASHLVNTIIEKIYSSQTEAKIDSSKIISYTYVILSRYDKLAAQQYWALHK